ncbi:MAG: ABC transporter substrate-binding protein [Candidatus Limnocylindrales bacterium]
MQRSFGWRTAATLVAGVILLAACSTAAPTARPPTAAAATAAAPTAVAPTAAPATPTAAPTTAITNSKDFWVGFTSVGLSSAPFLAAIADLNANHGYDIKTPILAQSELVAEGVAQGQFAFGSGANNGVLRAIEAGANLKVIVDRVANEWTLYVRNDITACADLTGKRLALHSDGAVSTAMVRNYINVNCAGTAPQEIFIEGSPNRVAALLADQVDSSPLELGDSITIDNEASDRYHLLSSFSADLPDLKTTSIYVNGDWAALNPQSVTDVVRAVIEQFRLVSADAAYLKTVAQEQVPDAINEDTIDQATAKYVELGMFDVNGGVTEDNLNYTAEFFGPDGTATVEKVFTLEEWADLSYLNAVLDELGRQ